PGALGGAGKLLDAVVAEAVLTMGSRLVLGTLPLLAFVAFAPETFVGDGELPARTARGRVALAAGGGTVSASALSKRLSASARSFSWARSARSTISSTKRSMRALISPIIGTMAAMISAAGPALGRVRRRLVHQRRQGRRPGDALRG